ncbi:MAG: serine/threonine protein kinase, partial [Anaerolineae bacterium]
YAISYEIIEELGRDDLTIIYRALRKSDGREVDIKAVAPQFTFDEAFVRKFQDAAQRAITLEHPNIVRTYEVGAKDDIVYLARERVSGQRLAEVLAREGSLPLARVVEIVRQIAAALDYAHGKAVTHGDLSDQAICLDADDRVTLVNFCEAQAVANTSLVRHGFTVGTPEYVAPEQVHGQGPSRAADLYALGVLTYQMLAGKPPFSGEPAAVLHAQAYEQPQPLHVVDPDIRVTVSETVARMLSKGLELRHATGAEFVRALQAAAKGTAPIRKPVAAAALAQAAGAAGRRPFYRLPAFWLFVITPLVGLLMAAGFWGVTYWSARQVRDGIALREKPTPVPTFSVQQDVASPTALPARVTNTPLPTLTPTALPSPTATLPSPTAMPLALPTPGEPVIAANSPFTNLRLSHGITEDSQPLDQGTSFAPGPRPIYLFFDYRGMNPNTPWTHTWTWADQPLERGENVWPEDYGPAGTAWVFYSPAGGYQPGPYRVTLEIEGRTVATATFVIEPGGL